MLTRLNVVMHDKTKVLLDRPNESIYQLYEIKFKSRNYLTSINEGTTVVIICHNSQKFDTIIDIKTISAQ